MGPCLGILNCGCNRFGNLIPRIEEDCEGALDLFLRGPAIAGDTPVGVFQTVTERSDFRSNRIPRIGLSIVRRIVFVRLHLLDGTYELFRSHFGRKDTVTAPDGSDVRATLGILESTLALLREPEVTHLAASFDTVIESFRNDMFAGYKSSAGMEEVLLSQFPLAEQALDAIGVVIWRNIEFEADDALAAAAVRWCDDVDQVVIATPDKDLSQVVIGDRIVTLNRREQKIINEAGVIEKFGVRPESIPDYLALVGDTADGVPGLPGWGAKSASAVLAKFRRLEMIPLDHEEWGVQVRSAAKLAETFRSNQEDLYLFRELTTLRLDVPFEETLEDLEWTGVPREGFEAFCETMGFDSTAIRVHRWEE
jgi:5'-3' exonuclease